MKRLALACLLAAITLMSVPGIAAALEPGQMLLVVNANVPEGRALAEFYRNARQIPDGRIIALKLPAADEIAFSVYERQVVMPIRQFLRDNKLDKQVTCLVTFYGMPLRIVPGSPSAGDREETAAVQAEVAKVMGRLRQQVQAMEAAALAAKPSFKPQTGDELDKLVDRAQAAMAVIGQRAQATTNPAERNDGMSAVLQSIRQLSGPAGVIRAFSAPGAAAGQSPQGKAMLADLAARVDAVTKEIGQLQDQRPEPAARQRIRELVGQNFGDVESIRLMQAQLAYLSAANTTAALDSALGLLWWTQFTHPQRFPNPLYFANQADPRLHLFPTMMVARLDAPQSGQVREMILTTLKTERQGLKGRIVLDSRAISGSGDGGKAGGYGWYDQSLRNLAELIRTKTQLSLLHEDSPQLLPAGGASGVALYCGWYSVRNYVACCRFVPGAVGFHVASFELVSLHAKDERGWVAGLINDGVAATLGPVAEPYLAAFPPADEFFPLLLTGKLTLAEVYWKTSPMVDWMMALVGDPLYTPFRVNPAMKVQDLPERLRSLVPPATQPAAASQPAATAPSNP